MYLFVEKATTNKKILCFSENCSITNLEHSAIAAEMWHQNQKFWWLVFLLRQCGPWKWSVEKRSSFLKTGKSRPMFSWSMFSYSYTLRAEIFAGRNFREVKKSRNFADLIFGNSIFGRNFTDKTFANFPKSSFLKEKTFAS